MAREKEPTGKEIKDAARTAALDRDNTGTGKKNGKTSKLTPAKLSHVKSEDDLARGQFIGVLETEIAGDSLPPGTYDLFVAKVGGRWKVYFESDGNIVTEAAHVQTGLPARSDSRPQYRDGSVCWWIWLVFWGMEVCC